MTELPAPVLPAGYRLVDLPASRLADLLEVDLWAFPSPRSVADLRGEPSPLTWDRARGIEADGVPGLVAMHASYPFADFPVPGATTAVAGLTWVGVHPGDAACCARSSPTTSCAARPAVRRCRR